MHFQVRQHFVRLLPFCHLSQRNKTRWSIGGKVQPLLVPYHQPSASDIVSQHNKTESITFSAALFYNIYIEWFAVERKEVWEKTEIKELPFKFKKNIYYFTVKVIEHLGHLPTERLWILDALRNSKSDQTVMSILLQLTPFWEGGWQSLVLPSKFNCSVILWFCF